MFRVGVQHLRTGWQSPYFSLPGGGTLSDQMRFFQAAIEREVDQFLSEHSDVTDEHGRRQVVRNGYKPDRVAVCHNILDDSVRVLDSLSILNGDTNCNSSN